MWESLRGGVSVNEFRDKYMSHKCLMPMIENYYVIGLGATIMNGYSYISPVGGMVYYIPNEYLDEMRTLVARFVYIPDYNLKVGFEKSNISSPARNICDYLMYPDKLGRDLFLLDALEGYLEEFNGDLSEVYKMMGYFNLKRRMLDRWLESCFQGE